MHARWAPAPGTMGAPSIPVACTPLQPMHARALALAPPLPPHPTPRFVLVPLRRGVPGAHLLMRVPAGRQPDAADLSFAANLAAWFSKSRADGKVEVTVCDPKHLSKPTGAKPGQVLVRKERTLVGRPAESAAARSGEAD